MLFGGLLSVPKDRLLPTAAGIVRGGVPFVTVFQFFFFFAVLSLVLQKLFSQPPVLLQEEWFYK